MVKSPRFQGVCAAGFILAFLAHAQAAVTINFNSSSGYSNAALAGQTDSGVGATWTNGATPAGNAITVVNTGTDGKASGTITPTNNSEVSLTLPSAEGPGADGKIQIRLDLTYGSAAGNTWKLIFKDAANAEMARFQIQGSGGQGRLPGGGGQVTAGMALAVGQTRTIFAVLSDFSGTKKALFYQDSVTPANKLNNASDPTDGGLAYTSITNAIKTITFQTFAGDQQGALVDNIKIAPEPTSLFLLGFASLSLMRIRRRVA